MENNIEVQQAVNNAMAEQKKKKRKKRLIILAVILVVIIAIVAISSGGDDSSESKSTESSQVAAQKEDEEEKIEGQIGKYICTVKKAEICKDWDGKDSVKITYSFTNNNDESESFDIALDDNVYQDGVELESTFISSDDDDFGIDVKIKPGVTKDVVKVYRLRDKETDLEVEIGELFSFDDTKITTTVKLDK